MVQKRKVPLRKCVMTGEMKPKEQLVRVVKNKDGDVFVDTTGKKNGRGAYITLDLEIINKAEETNVFNRHLNTNIESEIYTTLKKLVKDNQDEK